MTKPQHTPLPFFLDKGTINREYKTFVYATNKDGIGNTMDFEISCHSGEAEAEATATFIVRACNEFYQDKETIKELLEALENAKKALVELGVGSKLINEAIAKAKGGA